MSTPKVNFFVTGDDSEWEEHPDETRDSCSLRALGCDIEDGNRKCWIRPANGQVKDIGWVEVLNDDMLHLVCSSWARDATAFYLVSRPKKETSPNRKPASCSTSMVEKVSRESPKKKKAVADPREVPDRVKWLEQLVPSNKIDLFTQMELVAGDPDTVVVTDTESGVTLGLDGEMLHGFVKSEVAKGFTPDEVEVDCVKLNLEVWFTCLMRRNRFADKFGAILREMAEKMRGYETSMEALKGDQELYSKLKFFVRDLLNFGSDEEAVQRLERFGISMRYFTSPYFSEDDIERLTEFRVSDGTTVQFLLAQLFKDKEDVCASHDVAPLLQKVFGLAKGFQEQGDFKQKFKKFRKDWLRTRKLSRT